MRTIKGWLNTLPIAYRRNAIENCIEQETPTQTKVDRLSTALRRGFGWDESFEGWEFWIAILEEVEILETIKRNNAKNTNK